GMTDCITAVADLNGLAGPDQIAVGQVLQLPASASDAVTSPTQQPVTAGETGGQAGREAAVVASVTDGDTVVLADGRRLRYIGIDTPETTGECYASEASARNAELVLGKTVYFEKDVSEFDPFERLLRYVYLADG